MIMARINLSHGSLKDNLKLINRFKQAKRLRPHKTCALYVELRGREVRLSNIAEKDGTVRVRSGSVVEMIGGEFHIPSDSTKFRINCDSMQRYLKPNDVIYFDDGKVVGIVIEITDAGCKMEIKIGGTIKSACSVRFTGSKHNHLKLVTKQDVLDVQEISKHIMIDYLSVPFIVSGEDPLQIRELLGDFGKTIKILSKIDTLDGI
jgi:pyruvate kinase